MMRVNLNGRFGKKVRTDAVNRCFFGGVSQYRVSSPFLMVR
jgi:hypothetical protein